MPHPMDDSHEKMTAIASLYVGPKVTAEMIERADLATCRLDGLFRDLFNQEERRDILMLSIMEGLKTAKEYVNSSIASFEGDPANNQFQKGYLAALEVVRDEAFT